MMQKNWLAQLSADCEKPLKEYVNTEAAKAMANDIELLKTLEPMHLPEITKLICGRKDLQTQFSGYEEISLFFTQEAKSEIRKKMECRGIEYFAQNVFPYADGQLLKVFSEESKRVFEMLEQEQKELEDAQQEKKAADEKVKEQEERNREKAQQLEDGSATLRAADKGKLTKLQNECEQKEKRVQEIKEKIGKLENMVDAYAEACDQIEEVLHLWPQKRDKAFACLKKPSQMKKILGDYLETRDISDELAAGLKKESFTKDFLLALSEIDDATAVKTIAEFYRNSLLDIWDAKISLFLQQHEEAVGSYIFQTYMEKNTDDFCSDDGDRESWMNYLVDKSFENAQLGFRAFWESIPSIETWREMLSQIEQYSAKDPIDCLAVLLLQVKGASKKYLMRLVEGYLQEEVIESSAFLVKVLFIHHQKGDDCFALVERYVQELEKENRKLSSANTKLKYDAKMQSSKLYGAISEPVEKLELLASNISTGNKRTAAHSLSLSLKKTILALREGLERFEIFPVVQTEDWLQQKIVKFDPHVHRMNVEETPEKVYIRSLGFEYQSFDGNRKKQAALVERAQELPNSRKKHNSKSDDSTSKEKRREQKK